MNYLTAKAAAKLKNVSHPTITRAIVAGRLKAEKLGNTWMIDLKELDGFDYARQGRPKKLQLQNS